MKIHLWLEVIGKFLIFSAIGMQLSIIYKDKNLEGQVQLALEQLQFESEKASQTVDLMYGDLQRQMESIRMISAIAAMETDPKRTEVIADLASKANKDAEETKRQLDIAQQEQQKLFEDYWTKKAGYIFKGNLIADLFFPLFITGVGLLLLARISEILKQ